MYMWMSWPLRIKMFRSKARYVLFCMFRVLIVCVLLFGHFVTIPFNLTLCVLLFGHFVMMPFNLTLCVFCCSVILSWCPSTWPCVFCCSVILSRCPSTWPCVCFVVRSFCHDALQLDPVCVLLFGHFAMMPFNLTLCVFCCSVILSWRPSTWPCVFCCSVILSWCPST